MTIRVSKQQGNPYTVIGKQEITLALNPEETQELHISLGLDCKDPNCPCYNRGRADGAIFAKEHTGPAMKGGS